MINSARTLTLGLIIFTVCLLAAPGQTLPSYDIYRTPSSITIDGKLDERAWRQTPTVGDFRFNWWRSGEKEQTLARILWDEQNLYVAYYCYDKHISASVTERQGPVSHDDSVELYISPDPEKPQNFDGLEINVIGTMLGFRVRNGKTQLRWEPEGLRYRTSLHRLHVKRDSPDDDHWILELAIPWKNFSGEAAHTPPHDGDRWRLNLNRAGGVTNPQFSTWSPVTTPAPLFAVPESFGWVRFVKRTPPEHLPEAR